LWIQGFFAGIQCPTGYSQGGFNALDIDKGRTMTRKRLLALAASFTFASLLFCVWRYLETHKVRRGNFDRIQLGMTEDQVEGLLGGSAKGTIIMPTRVNYYYRYYRGHDCGILVYFNLAGEVDDMVFNEYPNRGWLVWLKEVVGQ
jgi:hypothetical protein